MPVETRAESYPWEWMALNRVYGPNTREDINYWVLNESTFTERMDMLIKKLYELEEWLDSCEWRLQSNLYGLWHSEARLDKSDNYIGIDSKIGGATDAVDRMRIRAQWLFNIIAKI